MAPVRGQIETWANRNIDATRVQPRQLGAFGPMATTGRVFGPIEVRLAVFYAWQRLWQPEVPVSELGLEIMNL